MKRIFIMLLCGLILMSGCAGSESEQLDTSDSAGISIMTGEPGVPDNTVSTEPTEPEPNKITEAPEPTVPQYPEIAAAKYSFDPQEFSELFEIEDGVISGSALKTDAREGFSGGGYVNKLTYGGNVVLEIELPVSQHYNITLRAASDTPASGNLTLNGAVRGSFALIGSGSYETVRFDNIYLPVGESQLSFSDLSGEMDLDCVLFENASEIYELTYEPVGGLSNLNADESAVELYAFLAKNYGKKVLSGQQVSQGTNDELEAIYAETGRYPAIRFGELMDYSAGKDTGDIELAAEWANSGGIVGYSWYWPMHGSVYQNRTAFDLSKAVTSVDIATMEGGALTLRYESGEMTGETLAVIDGIDRVSEQLVKLRDNGIVVIFRPLPEASNGQFWWSQSAEGYLWLYKLVYDRMTMYWKLNNLIWVWNGQSADWYPGDGLTDIISLDVYYPSGSKSAEQSGINLFISAREISENKIIAISECSALPTPDNIAMDQTYWSYCSTWTGDYSIGGSYMPIQSWIQFYNSETVLTRDEIEYNW